MRWLSTYSQEDWADLSVLNTYCGFETVIDPAYTDDFGTHGDGFVRGARIQLKATTGNTAIGNTGTITAGAGANHTRQLTLVDDYGDNRARDPFVVWDSSDDTKATVSATGLVTGVGAGAVNITADIDGFTKTYAATVS
uniref:Ig-like domain-containing protein n=1 Tax=Nitrospira cf. moscoviensis SBR1015 TaxID=96242 RepID=UPI000B3BAFF9|nr:Ig-like domain-containing protein [Nitrospira cf. moscoviensis SBR1015]